MALRWLLPLLSCSCAAVPSARWPQAALTTHATPTATVVAPPVASSRDAPIAAASPGARPASSPGVAFESSLCGAGPKALGKVDDARLDEVSGVVESYRDPRVLFVHNDSGDSPRFFAMQHDGHVLAELVLGTVPLLLDAEDIAIGPGPGGADFIYLGDTGNNFASFGVGIPRRKAVIYRIPEPNIPLGAVASSITVDEAFPIVFTFPNGACDIEAFVVDPWSGDLYLIGKRPDGHSQILTASAAQLAAGGGELALAGELRFGAPPLAGSPMPTSASISRDGTRILVRTYADVWLFVRTPGESIWTALQRPPRALTAPREPQGEAIAFVDGARAFVTISEGRHPVVNCLPLPAPAQ